MELTLSEAIADYIEQRKQAKLEPLIKARDKAIGKADNPTVIADAKAKYQEAAAPIEKKFEVKAWLTDAAKRARQISRATHAAKFTHGDAKANSILVNNTDAVDNTFLCTASLRSKKIDFVGNAAVFDVASLLKITANNESLIDQLQQGHVDALSFFTDDQELLKIWLEGFSLALVDQNLEAHNLTKQLYFPITITPDSVGYHLLCPLFSSSMSNELNQQVLNVRRGESKDIREARKKGLFHPEIDQSFPVTAKQNFGGSKPQNISQLNSERFGESYLLNSSPPNFQSQTKPPKTKRTIFDKQLNYKVAGYINDFKAFVAALNDSDRSFKVRYKRDHLYILPIIDVLFDYVASIQAMADFTGWSSDSECKLSRAYCLWLDALNKSPAFQSEREKGDWMDDIAHDFANWLVYRLKHKDFVLGDIEHQYFKKVFFQQLKRFERTTLKLGEV